MKEEKIKVLVRPKHVKLSKFTEIESISDKLNISKEML
jgi:hypothetical protein